MIWLKGSFLLFQNLFQFMLCGKDPIKEPIQYPIMVMMIPVFVVHPMPYQAGEDVSRIWENYRNAEGNFHKQSIAVFQHSGAACPVIGCGRCNLADCFFCEFIHHYWKCPSGD